MQLGRFELTTISGGRFRIDGGTMFGVVPKALWRRCLPPDDDNLIPQATNCVLVRSPDDLVLIDTGYGSKLSAKQQRIFQSEPDDPLLASLNSAGVDAADVTLVILSHLHFDHAGGATRRDEDGTLVPTFPNARYVVQREEWETATANLPELRGAYPQDNLLPLEEAGCLSMIEGDVEIIPGIRSLVTGGHTLAHQALVLESEGEHAIYLGDICPTWHHLPMAWCMGYDLEILTLRRKKLEILGMVADNDWLALSDHDPDHAAARLRRDDRRDFTVKEKFASL